MIQYAVVALPYKSDGDNDNVNYAVIALNDRDRAKLKARSELMYKDGGNGPLFGLPHSEAFMDVMAMQYPAINGEIRFFSDVTEEFEEAGHKDNLDVNMDEIIFMDDYYDAVDEDDVVVADTCSMFIEDGVVWFTATFDDGLVVETARISIDTLLDPDLGPCKEQLDVAESYAACIRRIQRWMDECSEHVPDDDIEELTDAITVGQNLMVTEWAKLTGKDEMSFIF